MKKDNNMTSFAEHLDEQYGKRETETREQYEQGFEAFKLGVMLQELRKEEGLTQVELAQRCQTTPICCTTAVRGKPADRVVAP